MYEPYDYDLRGHGIVRSGSVCWLWWWSQTRPRLGVSCDRITGGPRLVVCMQAMLSLEKFTSGRPNLVDSG